MLTEKQQIMENRYALPYNWMEKQYSIKWVHKFGLLSIILDFIQPRDRVLDVGCGDGWYSSKMADKGAIVHGIDFSERAVAFARLIDIRNVYDIGSSTNLPYPNDFFDVVTCIQVLEHIEQEDAEASLKEFKRVLKPNGKLIISVPSILRPMSKAHLRHYTLKSLNDLVHDFSDHTFLGHESGNRLILNIRKLFENKYLHLPKIAGFFYERIYFPYWNKIKPQKANNLIICCKAAKI